MAEPETVLIVDDEEPIRDILSSLLEIRGFACEAAPSAIVALKKIEESPDRYHLVLSDIIMPEMTGLAFLAEVLHRYPDLPVVMISAVQDINVALDAIRRGAYDYIVKPFEQEQLYILVDRALERRRLIEENRRYQHQLEEMVADRTFRLESALRRLERSYDVTLEALGSALDLKDSETEGHSRRVTAFTIAMAKAMGIEGDKLKTIARGAYLHDIGKMAIPDSILLKPGPLTPQEREIMRTHCQRGYEILSRISFLEEAAEIVLSHQEHYDGSGYPRALTADQIHIGARIFAVADTLDAIISDRPYRKARSVEEARQEILRMSGKQFDPQVVEAFMSLPDDLWIQLRANVGESFGLSTAAVK